MLRIPEYVFFLVSVIPAYNWTSAFLSLPFSFSTLQSATNCNWDTSLISQEKYKVIRCGIFLINYCIQCCGGKCLIASSLGKQQQLWFVVLPNFSGINSPTMADVSYEHGITKPEVGKRYLQFSLGCWLGHSKLQHTTDCKWLFYQIFYNYLTSSVILPACLTTCCPAQSQYHILYF